MFQRQYLSYGALNLWIVQHEFFDSANCMVSPLFFLILLYWQREMVERAERKVRTRYHTPLVHCQPSPQSPLPSCNTFPASLATMGLRKPHLSFGMPTLTQKTNPLSLLHQFLPSHAVKKGQRKTNTLATARQRDTSATARQKETSFTARQKETSATARQKETSATARQKEVSDTARQKERVAQRLMQPVRV